MLPFITNLISVGLL